MKTFVDQLIAVIIRKNDDEDKLVVAAKDRQYSKEEIRQAVNFQEQHFKSKIIIPGERREWDDE